MLKDSETPGYATRRTHRTYTRQFKAQLVACRRRLNIDPSGSIFGRRQHPVQATLASRAVLQVDQAAPAHQKIHRHQQERRQDTDMVRSGHLRAHRHCQEGASTQCLNLHMSTDFVGIGFRENPDFMRLAAR